MAEKYFGRGILLHLRMDVGVGVPDGNKVVRNLSTFMAGAQPANLPVQIQTKVTNIVSYVFVLPNDDQVIAMWTDGVAVEYDPGVPTTLTLSSFGNRGVMDIDVLYGFVQELIIETENGNLVIRNLLVKDYPTVL